MDLGHDCLPVEQFIHIYLSGPHAVNEFRATLYVSIWLEVLYVSLLPVYVNSLISVDGLGLRHYSLT